MRLLYVILFVFVGCSDNCEMHEMKCDQNMAMICNGENNWEVVTDCDMVEPVEKDWICCAVEVEDERIYACKPSDECEEDLDGTD
jgi:hypothetical protein